MNLIAIYHRRKIRALFDKHRELPLMSIEADCGSEKHGALPINRLFSRGGQTEIIGGDI